VEIKCQLDATEVFIADLIACSTCFGHHYAHHHEQAIRSAIKTSVASSWHFISTHRYKFCSVVATCVSGCGVCTECHAACKIIQYM